jgi:hypothetical protein
VRKRQATRDKRQGPRRNGREKVVFTFQSHHHADQAPGDPLVIARSTSTCLSRFFNTCFVFKKRLSRQRRRCLQTDIFQIPPVRPAACVIYHACFYPHLNPRRRKMHCSQASEQNFKSQNSCASSNNRRSAQVLPRLPSVTGTAGEDCFQVERDERTAHADHY